MIKHFKRLNKINLFFLVSFLIIFFTSAYIERNNMLQSYTLGKNKISTEEYEEAQKILSELGDYKDSLDQIKVAQTLERQKEIYDKAIETFNDEKYKDAIELFSQIENFKDSMEYIQKANSLLTQKKQIEALYDEAFSYYKTNNYILAIQNFKKLNGYNDSETIIQKCKLELAKLQQATTISAGIRSSVGMIKNGKVYLAGNDFYSWKSELDYWNNIISVSVKGNFVLGLKSDGTVVLAGKIPEYYVGTRTWTDIIAVSTGQQYIIGLKSDGTVVAQGHNGDGQVDIDDWTNIVSIATGWRHTVGLDSNGKIHITGFESNKQLQQIENHQDDWTNIVSISAGGGASGDIGTTAYTVALKQDKTVITTLTGDIANKLSKWTDIVAVSAGDSHIVGLKSDGTVVTTQIGDLAEEISKWTDIVAISAGYGFTLGLCKDGHVVATGYDRNGQIDVESWENITNYKEEWETIFDDDLRWNGFKE